MSTDEDIIFTGGSAVEAEDFIFAIKKRAYANGKHKDSAWIAEYASICFAKKALRWYETLDEETRNDWTLLKGAILDKYDEPAIPSAIVPASAPSAPGSLLETVPAAAPSSRIGRIRVDSNMKDFRGYISKTFAENIWCCICASQSNAATFDFDVASRRITFQDTEDNYVAVRIHQTSWNMRKGSSDFGGLFMSQGYKGAPKSGWSDDIEVDLWSIAKDGKLEGRWPLKTGGNWLLEGASLESDKRIYLSADQAAFCAQYNNYNCKPVTLYFESL